MTALNLKVVDLPEHPVYAPLVWDTKLTTGKVDILAWLGVQQRNLTLVTALEHRVHQLQREVSYQQQKLLSLTVNLVQQGVMLELLEQRLLELTAQVEGWTLDLTELLATMPTPQDLPVAEIASIAYNYTEVETLLHNVVIFDETELVLAVNAVTATAATSTSQLRSLQGQVGEYQRQLDSFTSKLLTLTDFSSTIYRNTTHSTLKLAGLETSFKRLTARETVTAELIQAYLGALTDLEALQADTSAQILQLSRYVDTFNASYATLDCSIKQKESSVVATLKSCALASERLKYYYNLFIGTNFIAAGEHVTLQRDGCYVTVSAALPPTEDCPNPLLVPQVFGDIIVQQAPLLTCPPQLCV